MSFFLLILFVFNFKLSKSQLCYAVDGMTSGLTGSVGTGLASSSYCPNNPTSACVYITDTSEVSATYDMSLYRDITFSVDYLLDNNYGTNDYTYIYYRCGSNSEFTGLRIGKTYNNANEDQAYLNRGFFLPSSCNYQSSIRIRISQVKLGSNTIYFNFDNMCLRANGAIVTSPPTMFPTNAPVSNINYDAMNSLSNWPSRSGSISVVNPGSSCGSSVGGNKACCEVGNCMRLSGTAYIQKVFSVDYGSSYCLSFSLISGSNALECEETVSISYTCQSSSIASSTLVTYYGNEVDAGRVSISIPCSWRSRITLRFATTASFEDVYIDEVRITANVNNCPCVKGVSTLIGTPVNNGVYAGYDDMSCLSSDVGWFYSISGSTSTSSTRCASSKCIYGSNGYLYKVFTSTQLYPGPYCLRFHAYFNYFDSNDYMDIRYDCRSGSGSTYLARIIPTSSAHSDWYFYSLSCSSGYTIITINFNINSNDLAYIDEVSITSGAECSVQVTDTDGDANSNENGNTTEGGTKKSSNLNWLIYVFIGIGVIMFLWCRKAYCSNNNKVANANNISQQIANNSINNTPGEANTTAGTTTKWGADLTYNNNTTNATANFNLYVTGPGTSNWETNAPKPFTFGLNTDNNNNNENSWNKNNDHKLDNDSLTSQSNNNNDFKTDIIIPAVFEPGTTTTTITNDNYNNNSNNDPYKPSAPAPPSYDDVIANPNEYEVQGTPPPGYGF